VTVTHPDMVRYFMTIREACDLVVTAASHASEQSNGDASVYVLNMGQPVKIVELAERIIRLSGLEPERDIKIAFTGIRPGERLNEILVHHTGQPMKRIQEDTERDYIMSADQGKEYGIIDDVIRKRA